MSPFPNVPSTAGCRGVDSILKAAYKAKQSPSLRPSISSLVKGRWPSAARSEGLHTGRMPFQNRACRGGHCPPADVRGAARFPGRDESRPTVSTVYHPLAIIFSSAPSGARSTAIPNFFPTHNKSRPGCPPGGRFIVSSIPSACRPAVAKSAAVFNPRRFHRCWRCFRRGSRCRWPCGLRARSAARRYRQSPWFPGSWSGPGRL